MDERIGVTGGVEPAVCAVSGQDVRGQHAVTIALDGTHYVRVLTFYYDRWTEALAHELRGTLPIPFTEPVKKEK